MKNKISLASMFLSFLCTEVQQTAKDTAPGTLFLFISVRGKLDPKTIVRLEGLGELKNPVTS
jgi:hypothetical protein